MIVTRGSLVRVVLVVAAVLAYTCAGVIAVPDPARAGTLASYYGWGDDQSDQLGDGGSATGADAPVAVALPGHVAAAQVAVGGFGGIAIGSDQNLYAWGSNGAGQVGNGTTTSQPAPEQVSLAVGVSPVAIAEGEQTSYAIGSDGNLYGWGYNGFGQLGDGSTIDEDAPEVISLAPGVTAVSVSAGLYYALAIGSDGNLYAWGDNRSGQLGDGSTTEQPAPEQIALAPGVSAVAVAAGSFYSFAIGSDGTIYTWGSESGGALGNGVDSSGTQLTPEPIALPGSVKAQAVAAGNTNSPGGLGLAIGASGKLYAWGDNTAGAVGVGGSADQDTPAVITLAPGVKPVSIAANVGAAYAIGSDGNLYGWGDPVIGQPASTPEQLPLTLGTSGQIADDGDTVLATAGSASCTGQSLGQVSPPLQATADIPYAAFFSDDLCPPPAYALSGAPDWLSIDAATGVVSGVPPDDTASFSYSVSVTSGSSADSAGPFTVTVGASATIAGTVQLTDGSAVSGAQVQSCLTSGGQCATAVTAADGSYTVLAPADSAVGLTAYPPAGKLGTDSPASLGPLSVGSELTGQTLTLAGVGGLLPGGLSVNGSTAAPSVLGWGSPAAVGITGGCPNGVAAVSLAGTNLSTGEEGSQDAVLTESPAGSGSFSGTLPPGYPIHGAASVSGAVACPGSAELVPDIGPASGGGSVIVTGTGFTAATAVLFGSAPSPGFVVESDNTLVATVPPGIGDAAVSVRTPGGPIGLGAGGVYSYLGVSALSPESGPAAGGSVVTITGGGFSQASAVQFGSVPATSFTVVSDTKITATAPAGSGVVDVQLIGPAGETATSPADQFSYGGASQIAARQHPARQHPARQHPARQDPARQDPARQDPARQGPARQGPAAGTASAGQHVSLPPGFQVPPIPPGYAPPTLGCLTGACIQTWLSAVISQTLGGALAPLANQAEQYAAAQIGGDLLDIATNGICNAAGQALAEKALSALLTPAVAALIAAEVAAFLPEGVLVAGAAKASLVVVAGEPAFFASIELQWAIELRTLIDKLVGKLIDPLGDSAIQQLVHSQCANPAPDPGAPSANALVDPSGTVSDTGGGPVNHAAVTILGSDTAAGPFTKVDPTSPGIEPAVNPETTGGNGVFRWDVSAGYYQVQATAPDCFSPGDPDQAAVTSGVYPVPPPQAGLVVTLRCSADSPPPQPAVTGLSSLVGPPAGGTSVTISGTGFTPASAVAFGSTAATTTTYLSSNELQVVAPAGAPGAVDVTVTTAGGTSAATSADQFTYAAQPSVAGLSPASGAAPGGTVVTISGHGFTSATSVAFGLTPAASYTVVSDAKITATAPAGTAGLTDVTVNGPGGASQQVAADQFAYQQKSTGASISSSANPAGIGAAVTFTATVTPAPDNGSVQFAVDGQDFGNPVPVSPFTGQATTPATKLAGGSHQVTASYLGDASYGQSTSSALGQVVITAQALLFTSRPPKLPLAGNTYALAASGGASGNPVRFSIDRASVPGTCLLAGQTVQFTAIGVCVIDANQAGNSRFAPAPQVSQRITVGQIPFFVLHAPPLSATDRHPYSYAFLAQGSPQPSYTLAAGAPKWLSISAKTGLLTGTPPAGVTSFRYSVTATSTAGRATAGSFKVSVTGQPSPPAANLSATLACPVSAVIGTTFSCTLTVRDAGPAAASATRAAIILPVTLPPTATGGGQRLGTVIEWSVGTIAAGKTITRKVTLQAYQSVPLTLSALAWSATPDPSPTGNFTTHGISVLP